MHLLLLSLVHTGAALAADAPPVPPINAQEFRPSIDSAGTLWVDEAALPDYRVGGRALLHYTLNPLVYQYDDGEQVRLVSDVVQADVTAGFTLWRVRLGLDLPLYLYQVGAAGSGVGLGEIAPDVKFGVLDGRGSPIGLAIEGRTTLPTSTVGNALGSSEVGWEAAVVVDRWFGDVFRVAANVGLRGGPKTALENVTLNDFLTLRLGGALAATRDAGVAVELAGQKGLADAGMASFPLEGLVSGYGYLSDTLVLRGGVGTGLTRGIGSPDLRVMAGLGYEPKAPPPAAAGDVDHDRVPDDADACLDVAEDRDGHEDADGCPEPDNDADGIPDVGDPCPNAAEDEDGVKDGDGCPEPEVRVGARLLNADTGAVVPVGRVILHGPVGDLVLGPNASTEIGPGTYEIDAVSVTFEPLHDEVTVGAANQIFDVRLKPGQDVKITVTRDRIDLREKVYFDTGNDTIQARSFALLDQVAQAMVAYPEIALLSVEGHTDNRGNDSTNLDLSLRRAQAVVNYLMRKGVPGNRVVAKGYGETRPIDAADNEAAWEANRRVEVLIESWNDAAGQ